ncbi:RNase adapter RapZ [Acidocella sp.]|uniref:RNase adapter RapZ n=1 Tax=Acidocella sp. TaxID=50710 RepID=UPI00262D5A80|nr:RNase adapter RapZ [Acidocella sp.]
MTAAAPQIVLVTGLSGAGKLSILRALEDLGFETVDNPPLAGLFDLAVKAEQNLAIGVDARSRGFSAESVLETMARLRQEPQFNPSLIFATASDEVLIRRYSETRRRHPLAQSGAIAEGIALERDLTAPLAGAADWLVDTSALPVPKLRRLVEDHFGAGAPGMVINLVSFAFPAGLPPEADLVFDARFLKNPHYEPCLQSQSGLDPEVGTFIEQDPDFAIYFYKVLNLAEFLLPRFVQEGKKYATICVGCTGGQHRSVYMVEKLSSHLTRSGWRVGVTHREAARFHTAAAAPPGIASGVALGIAPGVEANTKE